MADTMAQHHLEPLRCAIFFLQGDPNSFDELYESQGRKTKKRKPRLQSTIPLLEEDFIMQVR